MTETIAVLFIFFVLVMFGMIFYYKYAQVAIAEEQEEALGKRAIDISLQTLFLPELICSKGAAEAEDNCVDKVKLIHAQSVMQQQAEYYFEIFGYARVSIQQIYPSQEEFILYDRPLPDWQRRESSRFVIVLKDTLLGADIDTYSYAYMLVEVYG